MTKANTKTKRKVKKGVTAQRKRDIYIYAERLIARIQKGDLDAARLDVSERRACVTVLRHVAMTRTAMAAFLKVSRTTLYEDLREIRRGLGVNVDSLEIKEITGDIIDTAGSLYTRALKKDDISLAWRIKIDLVKVLQDLGYLRRHLGELLLTDKFDEMTPKELDDWRAREERFLVKAKKILLLEKAKVEREPAKT